MAKAEESAGAFQAVLVSAPAQRDPPSVDIMGVAISSYPPLGQVTQVKTNNIHFTVLLEVGNDDATQPWQVALWCSTNESTIWTTRELVSSEDESAFSSTNIVNSDKARLYFRGTHNVPSISSFTIKYRKNSLEDWSWVKDDQSMDDGTIIVNPEDVIGCSSTPFSDIFNHLDPGIRVRSTMSQSPATELWTLEVGVGPAHGEGAGSADFRLGKPWGHWSRWFALARTWSPWLAPQHGSHVFTMDSDAVVVSFLSRKGEHLVLLGLSGLRNVSTVIRKTHDGQISMHVENDGLEKSTGTILAAIGYNFESVMAAVMYQARNVVTQAQRAVSEQPSQEVQSSGDDVKPQWYENWYDGLGYCV
jgi:hypothetical protein